MARMTTRRPEEDEEILEDVAEDELDDEKETPVAPAVSDSRRRRMIKRGELPTDEADSDAVSTPVRKDRPTPSQRVETAKSNNIVVRTVENVREYFREVMAELSKVTWLTTEENLRLTYIVLIATAVAAAFLGLVSYLFGLLTQALANASTGIWAGAITIGLVIVVSGVWLLRDRFFPQRFE